VEEAIDDQVGEAYMEYNELIAEPTTPPRTMIPDTTHEETPRVPGKYKQEQSSNDERPPSPTPKPKEKKPEITMMTMAEMFKVLKPRTYTRDIGDRAASTLDAWIQKLKDYLELSGIHENKNKVLVGMT
jgi:hypothetical protein